MTKKAYIDHNNSAYCISQCLFCYHRCAPFHFLNSKSYFPNAKCARPLWFFIRFSSECGQNVAHGNPHVQKSSGYIFIWRFKRANYWTLNDFRAKNAFVFWRSKHICFQCIRFLHISRNPVYILRLPVCRNEDYQRESERPSREKKAKETFSKSFVQMNEYSTLSRWMWYANTHSFLKFYR